MKRLRACVVGAGRFGAALAQELVHRGCHVTVVDIRACVIDDIKGHVDVVVLGDVTPSPTLDDLHLDRYDVICVATGKQLLPFLSVISVLRPDSMHKVHCRIVNEAHRSLAKKVGITHTMECESFGAYHYADHICGIDEAKSRTGHPF